MKVAILCGGRSSEREVSLGTAARIHDAATDAGHDVTTVRIERSGAWCSDGERLTLSPGEGLLGCDVVFPALHGAFGEDGTVQGLLELLDVPYVGAGVLASSLCMDKAAFKAAMAAAGVPQVPYRVIREHEWREDPDAITAAVGELGLPVFVKPARLGSSLGIVKVSDACRLSAALETAFTHDGVVVVEQYCAGIEVECGVIGLTELTTSVPGEIVLRGADWYTYQAKYAGGGHDLLTPPRIPSAVSDDVRRLAQETFVRVGCQGLARVDFFVEGDRVLVNEVNTIPGFTETCVFPRLWEASGMSLSSLCDRLLHYALQRFRTERCSHAF